jgi:hypothetical protein
MIVAPGLKMDGCGIMAKTTQLEKSSVVEPLSNMWIPYHHTFHPPNNIIIS